MLSKPSDCRVIIPYTMVHPVIVDVMEPFSPTYVEMENELSYWRLMCDIWAKHEDVVIVEHDVIPYPFAIEGMWDCQGSWCSVTYQSKKGYGVYHMLGCTKLGTKLMDELPDVWQNVATTDYWTLDAQLCDAAQRQGIIPHPHWPPCTHLHGMGIYKPIAEKHEKIAAKARK